MPNGLSHDARGRQDTDVAVVRAWHDALNTGDLDRLMTLMHDDIEFGGPRGTGRGAAMVRDWAERSGIHLEPTRSIHGDDAVVVAQRAHWPDPDTGERTSPDGIASVFQVRDGRIQCVVRYGNLQDALAAAGSGDPDENP